MMQSTETTVVLQHPTYTIEKPITHRTWYQQMDGLRFIAVTAVLIEHFASFIGERFHLGFFGVDLFFVISGFLITEGLLIDKEKHPPKAVIRKFYLRRFLRIFPIYYLVIILAFIFYKPFSEIAGWAFTYTVNYYHGLTGKTVVAPFGHLWSLAVEEQFYIFWPCVVLFVPRKYFFAALGIIFTGSLIFFLTQQNWWQTQELPARMYSLCMGAFLAYIKTKWPDKYKANIGIRVISVFLLAVCVYFLDHGFGLSIFSFGLVYLGSNNAFKGLAKRFLQNSKVIFIGKISYGVYLYHMIIAFIFGRYILDPLWSRIHFGRFQKLQYQKWMVELPLYFLLTFIVAYFSYKLIEQPILKYKDKIK